jgi:hypothetical protein
MSKKNRKIAKRLNQVDHKISGFEDKKDSLEYSAKGKIMNGTCKLMNHRHRRRRGAY